MNKIYLSADEYLRDTFRLARQVMDSGWTPDELIALWRGGAPVGVGIHEFLSYHGIRVGHHVLKCKSYTGIRVHSQEVVFESEEGVLSLLKPGERVLVVDDVFDSGNTMRAMLAKLAGRGLDVKLATVYWKPNANQTTLKPDYYVNLTDEWLVFPHEMEGLTPEEIRIKDPVLYGLLRRDPDPEEGVGRIPGLVAVGDGDRGTAD